MANQDNLTSKQSDYAIFLPAISGFYATFIGKQRNEEYVDTKRFPVGLTDMEQLNWLNSQKSMFPYKWSLYSGGHANLNLNKQDWKEDMVRNREPGTLVLGDSGGFQIGKGLWEGDWKANSGCPKAQAKRDAVLKWLDNISDYAMTLDIPTWIGRDPIACARVGINPNDARQAYNEAVAATHYNNEYFIKNRKGIENGGTKILNVLQGGNHGEADEWYNLMKGYCDPAQYPGRHFNGWAMGGQNMCDVHLILRRLISLKYDNLLQPGIHDWMHFLGTSRLEWAVLLTILQRSVRKHVNPKFTISFDCASPFLATANGQVYYENVFPENGKWGYRMESTADDKKYATDTRKWSMGVTQDGIHDNWQDSPVSDLLAMKDICIYKPGDLNKIGKEGRTSWDSFSYALLMGHNVWMHLTAVQEANRKFDSGTRPSMMQRSDGDYAKFEDIIEKIFTAPDRSSAEAIIEEYSGYWMEIIGTRGLKGKKALSGRPMFAQLFTTVDEEDPEELEQDLDQSALDNLEDSQ